MFERRYADRAFADFADLMRAFRDEAGASVERACLGVAGPIAGRRVDITNFPWRIDAAFNATGTHARLAARIPAQVVVNERLGLPGAVNLAPGV